MKRFVYVGLLVVALAFGGVTIANGDPPLITGAQVQDESLTGADILNNSLTGDDVNESTLALPPSYSPGYEVVWKTADLSQPSSGVVYCPAGKRPTGGGGFGAASGDGTFGNPYDLRHDWLGYPVAPGDDAGGSEQVTGYGWRVIIGSADPILKEFVICVNPS